MVIKNRDITIWKDAQKSLSHIIDKIPNSFNKSALDIFAREGDWISYLLQSKFKYIEAWEIEEKYIPKLKDNCPPCQVHCRDSIEFIKNNSNYKKFDFLLVDNGLNCYGENKEFCEHFDVLPYVNNVLKDESFIVFNVVRSPFNYQNFPDWIKRRNDFYNLDDCSEFNLKFIKDFYTDYFNNLNYNVVDFHLKCREYYNNIDYNYMVGIQLSKVKD